MALRKELNVSRFYWDFTLKIDVLYLHYLVLFALLQAGCTESSRQYIEYEIDAGSIERTDRPEVIQIDRELFVNGESGSPSVRGGSMSTVAWLTSSRSFSLIPGIAKLAPMVNSSLY